MRALIVSHGQPCDPEAPEVELATLAARVAALLPGWEIRSATLAKPAALAQAAAGIPGRVYPLFMAGGWFTRVQLPAKLAEAAAPGWQVLEPLGCDPAVHDLATRLVQGAASVILAAHGSGRSPVPADVARHVAARIAATGIRAAAAFIDQAPQIAQATGHGPGSVCLPFFAASGGHVTEDIPSALAEAGFQGRLLPALGLSPEIPAIIAAAIAAGVPVCATDCRWRNPASDLNIR